MKLVPVYVTQMEQMEAEKIENKSVPELTLLIFQKIDALPIEKQQMQEEIFEKTIKNKKKDKYIQFFYELCELLENESEESDTDSETENVE